MSTQVTLTGRIGGVPELKFSQNGKAVATFSVVTDRRQLNKQTNEWESTGTTWWRCVAFGELAENLCETFADKGAAVIVVGRVEEETWNDKNSGQKRSAMKVVVEEIGPSLKYATAKVTKAQRSGGNGGGQNSGGNSGYGGGQGQGGRQQQSASGGGWGGSNTGGWGEQDSGSGWSSSRDDAPPF
ncbi:single-stranded DNA-binding protein [Mycobacterium sp.]|uniref:single-stranded DNA-binding protein n=1 Tax=Mycobacterium sp. TaxID=1785 RepID=UPI00260DD73F|nr:single-stranded DNA-binding protein [Mycobacterium sp.]